MRPRRCASRQLARPCLYGCPAALELDLGTADVAGLIKGEEYCRVATSCAHSPWQMRCKSPCRCRSRLRSRWQPCPANAFLNPHTASNYLEQQLAARLAAFHMPMSVRRGRQRKRIVDCNLELTRGNEAEKLGRP